MKTQKKNLLTAVALLSLCANTEAWTPSGDAIYREKEIRRRMREVRENYEQRKIETVQTARAQTDNHQAKMNCPPWRKPSELSPMAAAEISKKEIRLRTQNEKIPTSAANPFSISFSLLLLCLIDLEAYNKTT